MRNDGFYFPKGSKERQSHFWSAAKPFLLAMENPTNPAMDVGVASFRISLAQRSFEAAFKVLLSHVAAPIVPVQSILGAILPTTSEMDARALNLSTKTTNVSRSGRGTKRHAVNANLSDMDTDDSSQKSDGSSRYTDRRKGGHYSSNNRSESRRHYTNI